MEAIIVHWGSIGIMEKKMETIIMENRMEKRMENEMETRDMGKYCGYLGIMEKKMETTKVHWGSIARLLTTIPFPLLIIMIRASVGYILG